MNEPARHRLEVEVTAPNEWGCRMTVIRIDGRPLVELTAEIEAPIAAAAGQPDLAGKYDYLSAASVVTPSRLMLGNPARHDGRVAVLGCDCGIVDCWPLLVRITVTGDAVIWSDFRQPHRDNWVYPADLRFAFDRTQYERALAVKPDPPLG